MSRSPEHDIQVKIAKYLDTMGLLWTASAGGMRTGIRTAVKMKAAGYKKGTPDIMIFEPRGDYHALFIELKTKKGTASKEQKQWIEYLSHRGYKAAICKGLDAALDTINDYIMGKA